MSNERAASDAREHADHGNDLSRHAALEDRFAASSRDRFQLPGVGRHAYVLSSLTTTSRSAETGEPPFSSLSRGLSIAGGSSRGGSFS